MADLTRRSFLGSAAAVGAMAAGRGDQNAARAQAAASKRKMKISLRGGGIGVHVNQREAIDLAHRHGFEAVTPKGQELAKLEPGAVKQLRALLEAKQLAWGAADLPVQFRRDEPAFTKGLEHLPAVAQAARHAGVTRVGTYLSPTHGTMTYRTHFAMFARRLRECAKVLADQGVRLGLEYVGPKRSWSQGWHPFIHTLAETKELIAEIGMDNVGIVLDSWHWYCAGETVDDLRALKNAEVVAVDLNDAPRGVAREDQFDLRRELPAATGVIDLAGFVNALSHIGYDGPVRAEPFNATLEKMSDDRAVAATAAAMKRAIALIK